MTAEGERRHHWHLRWITFKGYALIVGMWVAAAMVAAVITVAWLRLITPESWWTP